MTASPLISNQVRSVSEIDYAAWIEATLQKLGQLEGVNVDWKNVIEKIADMGAS